MSATEQVVKTSCDKEDSLLCVIGATVVAVGLCGYMYKAPRSVELVVVGGVMMVIGSFV